MENYGKIWENIWENDESLPILDYFQWENMGNIWETYEKHMGKYGKHMGNVWEIMGKYMANIWETYGKMMSHFQF